MMATVERLATMHEFTRGDVDAEECARVRAVAHELLDHVRTDEIKGRIKAANIVNGPSHAVQACVLDHLVTRGFTSEKKGLFHEYPTAGLRPDYFLDLGHGRGVILEVERGKTLINNMDVLDLWKCHICIRAQYLFLMVPFVRVDRRGIRQVVFDKTIERLAPFFIASNYVNVDGLFVFGY